MGLHLQIACLIALVFLAGNSCSTRAIRQIHSATTDHSAVSSKLARLDWPLRVHPSTPLFETKTGTSPKPLGVFGQCQVLDLSPHATNPLLLFASQAPEPVRDSGKPIDINLLVDEDSVIRVVSHCHRMTIGELEAARATPTRGTVVYLGSLMGVAPAEQKLLSSLRLDGWNIIACLPPSESFTDIKEILIENPQELSKAAKDFAKLIDQHLAERVFVAESAIEYVKETRPHWLKGDLIIIGSSAGALALPAVVARIGHADSAVFIGGGADIASVMIDSSLNLTKISIRVEEDVDRSLTEVELEQFKTIAHRHIKLDPSYLASVLDNIPSLLLLGKRDTIVPFENGKLLHSQLGKPDLWNYPLGHSLLIGTLPLHAESINTWINDQCPPKVKPSPIPFEMRPRIRVRITENTVDTEDSSRRPRSIHRKR